MLKVLGTARWARPTMNPSPFEDRDAAVTEISGNIVDVFKREIRPGTLLIHEGRIAEIRWNDKVYDTWLMPGFVDAHIHIESSMLPPCEFARMAVVHGTVATVSDPHEIANVLGVEGVRYMQDDASHSPFKFHFGAPSCVPATRFDHAGAEINAQQISRLLDDPEIKYLSEMMNYPGVVADDPEVLAKLAAAQAHSKPIDGHAPRLRGADLAKYARAGISTDHECFERDEALEKLRLGMKILIREGSAAKNFDELYTLMAEFPERCMLCSDDKHPHELIEGHINQLVNRAMERSIDLFDVLQAACVNPVMHYGLDVGLLRRGDAADFIEVDSLERLNVLRVFVDGVLAAKDGKTLWPRIRLEVPNRFRATKKQESHFAVPAGAESIGKLARVIEAVDGQLVTRCVRVRPLLRDGFVQSDPQNDLLKLALVDRYDDRPPVVALARNFGLKRGAIASSVSHDSHNILAVGTSDHEIARAVNLIIAARGGISIACEEIEEVLALPIGGLMSSEEGSTVAAHYSRLDALAKQLGSTLSAPFMTLSFMALLVIPALKLSPLGLFDVGRFEPVGWFDEGE
jgi:adenine deaminase